MKILRAWIPATLAAALAALGMNVSPAAAQYPQYGAAQPQYAAPTPYGVAPRSTQPPVYSQNQASAYGAPVSNQAPPATQAARQPVAPYGVRPQQAPQYQQPQAQYQQPQYNSPYVARRAQDNAGAGNGAMQGESLPAPVDPSMINDGTIMTNGNAANGAMMQPGYDAAAQAGYGSPAACNCNAAGQYPSTGYQGGDYANCGAGQDYGISNYFDSSCGGTQWFGGVYWLFMNRDNASFNRLTVQVDDNNVGAYPYYPPARTTVLSTIDADSDFRSGAELRFGSTFSIGDSCDSGSGGYGGGYGNGCGSSGPSCSTTYGWEVAFWGLDDRENVAYTALDLAPGDNMRYYGMKNFAGLEYDRDGVGGGAYAYRPVNDYYDYQVPVQDPTVPAAGDIRVIRQSFRANFQAQNLELNFLKLPIYTASCAPAGGGCDSGCGGYAGTGAGGYGTGYGTGCGTGGCGPSCGSAFSITGLCGARYFKVDDDVAIDTSFDYYDGAAWEGMSADKRLYYDVEVDNRLVGFQLGCNMNYSVACKWNLFCDSNFGVYNNDANVYQRLYGAVGEIREVETGRNASYRTSKNDVAFLGEMRLGGAYDLSCHWRAVAAYRAIAISGLALSTDQIPSDFSNAAEVGLVDTDGSMIIHGLQVGAECRY